MGIACRVAAAPSQPQAASPRPPGPRPQAPPPPPPSNLPTHPSSQPAPLTEHEACRQRPQQHVKALVVRQVQLRAQRARHLCGQSNRRSACVRV